MRTTISMAAQFRGPPNSVNGGYACGVMGRMIDGPFTAVLRAPPPLDTPMAMIQHDGGVRLESQAGDLIGEARPADAAAIPAPPLVPSLAAAIAASPGFPGLHRPVPPDLLLLRRQGRGGRRPARLHRPAGRARRTGVVAGPWTPNPAFADADGLMPAEVVWAALDCPGAVSWVVSGAGGGMLGTMTGEMIRRPAAGETCIVLAWPIERSGRKLISGTALFSRWRRAAGQEPPGLDRPRAGRRSGLNPSPTFASRFSARGGIKDFKCGFEFERLFGRIT